MEDKFKKILAEEFPNIKKLQLDIQEDKCCGGAAIQLLLITDDIKGMNLIQRHQMIQNLLSKNGIEYHEIQIKVFTIEEAQKKGLLQQIIKRITIEQPISSQLSL